jgi:3'-phosphoadenosine 5'-phosphosulfate sulfotransferase (PAPS reductase)/FAD synthetase
LTKTSLPADLRRLEAEAIYIFREVAAEFRKPVLLYSIGKDSSVSSIWRERFFSRRRRRFRFCISTRCGNSAR